MNSSALEVRDIVSTASTSADEDAKNGTDRGHTDAGTNPVPSPDTSAHQPHGLYPGPPPCLERRRKRFRNRRTLRPSNGARKPIKSTGLSRLLTFGSVLPGARLPVWTMSMMCTMVAPTPKTLTAIRSLRGSRRDGPWRRYPGCRAPGSRNRLQAEKGCLSASRWIVLPRPR